MRALVALVVAALRSVSALFRSRQEQVIVELALRQQLAIYAYKQRRPRVCSLDRAFWVALSRWWPRWRTVLVVVQPQTVVRWQRRRFRHYWRSISSPGPGRPTISRENQDLIVRMATENGWRARRIQGELAMLALRISLATISRYLILDNDAIFSDEVARSIAGFGIDPKRTTLRSPWQNGTAELFVGTVRRELLDHVVVLDEQHLRRLVREYVEYYNRERVHSSLADVPRGRVFETRPSGPATVTGLRRVGGLHHRYSWRRAA